MPMLNPPIKTLTLLSALLISTSAVAQDAVTPLPVVQAAPQLNLPSLMYPQDDIRNLQRVLSSYIQSRSTQAGPDKVVEDDSELLAELMRSLEKGEEVQEIEDVVLPDIYVSSIVYRNASDWAVWINQEKLTNRKPASATQQIEVLWVSPRRIRFAWKPEKMLAAYKRYRELLNPVQTQDREAEEAQLPATQAKQQAETVSMVDPALLPDPRYAHRLAKGGVITFDEENGRFEIELQSHQTFASDSMSMYEGRFTTQRQIAAAQAEKAERAQAVRSPGGTAPADRMSNERAIADELLNNIQGLQQFIPDTITKRAGGEVE
jgi:hypothetical protein